MTVNQLPLFFFLLIFILFEYYYALRPIDHESKCPLSLGCVQVLLRANRRVVPYEMTGAMRAAGQREIPIC